MVYKDFPNKSIRKITCSTGESCTDYTEYLRTRHWAKTKREVAAQFNGVPDCVCGSDTSLNLHHLTYDRLGQELLRDLVFLCRTCHEIVHKMHRYSSDTSLLDITTQYIDTIRRDQEYERELEQLYY